MGESRELTAPVASRQLPRVRRLVVKVGSSLIASAGEGLAPLRIQRLADELAATWQLGVEIALVSSGAIAAGMGRLGLASRPRSIPEKQAAAAVGQSQLMWHYEQAFSQHLLQVAQVLLTQEDISHRARYLNARNTLMTLLHFRVLPIINENDTVAVEEIKVGDNDNLAALVAHLIDADLLVILTDVDGLYTGDPRRDPSARRLELVETITPELARLVWDDDEEQISVGGMGTKLQAAQKAVTSGIPMVIAGGEEPQVIRRILRGEPVGTYFLPRGDRLAARKRWIAFAAPPQGRLYVDHGACRAVAEGGKSLLPSGLLGVEGEFDAGEVVGLLDPEGKEFARGVTNYAAQDLQKICGAKTTVITQVLGHKSFDEVIHRDNLVVL
jgi:glutamate 5-kinase